MKQLLAWLKNQWCTGPLLFIVMLIFSLIVIAVGYFCCEGQEQREMMIIGVSFLVFIAALWIALLFYRRH